MVKSESIELDRVGGFVSRWPCQPCLERVNTLLPYPSAEVLLNERFEFWRAACEKCEQDRPNVMSVCTFPGSMVLGPGHVRISILFSNVNTAIKTAMI